MEYLDTTIPKSKFNKEFRKYYDSYYFSLRKEYLNIIDVNFYKKINLDLLVSSVSEKNISSSYIFHNICLYYSIKKFLSKRDVENIYVENTFLKKNIEFYYAGTVKIKNSKKINTVNIFRILLKQFLIFFISKLISKDKKIKGQINLIDIFITSNNLKIDRYYNNFFLKKKFFYYISNFCKFMFKKNNKLFITFQ